MSQSQPIYNCTSQADNINVITSEARDRTVKTVVKSDKKLSDILQKKDYKSYYMEKHGNYVSVNKEIRYIVSDSDQNILQENGENSFGRFEKVRVKPNLKSMKIRIKKLAVVKIVM